MRNGKGGKEVEEKEGEGKEGGRGGRVKSPTYDSINRTAVELIISLPTL